MRRITISHSPDADDAFMFYGFEAGAVRIPGFEFSHDLADIETLNQRALRGELEVTAVSVHAFSYLAPKFAILRAGASMGGENYGPKIVMKGKHSPQDLAGKVIGLPGDMTSAALATKLYLRELGISAQFQFVPFAEMEDAVFRGDVAAGVIIHEGQLTHEQRGLQCVTDLGRWWYATRKMPLPLGVNIVRRDLGRETMNAVSTALKTSIEYGLQHRRQALEYALPFGRGIQYDEADTFVGMYVNEYTRDIGEVGIKSITTFLREGAETGLCPSVQEVLFV